MPVHAKMLGMLEDDLNEMQRDIDQAPEIAKSRLMRLMLLFVFVAGGAIFFALGLDRFLTFDTLRDGQNHLHHFVIGQGIFGISLYILIYMLSVMFSVPGTAVLTIAGGLLFGQWFGTFYAIVGATFGAIGLFLIARMALRDILKNRAGSAMKKMEDGFKENALSYLLVLRLIPLFPFFLVNIVPALLGINLRTYVVGTFFGIIPGSFVYATVGAGLGSVFERNEKISMQGILTPEIMTALIGLALLALLPVAYKKFWQRLGKTKGI